MRNFFWMLCLSAVFLTGCQKAETIAVSKQVSAEKETILETEPEILSIEERASLFRTSENQHIYDECSVLTEEEFTLHNDYLEWIASTRLVNAFLVITDNLNGNSPEQFAESYYQTVSDAQNPDGFLVLINNDTNRDYIFTSGRCQHDMPQSEISVLISGATRDLIEGDYTDAFSLILPLSEQIPAYLADRTDTLTEAEIQEFSEKIHSVQEDSGIQCALLLLSFPEADEPDADAYRQQFGCDVLLVIDPVQKKCLISGNTADSLTEEILQIWNEQSLSWAVRYFFETI